MVTLTALIDAGHDIDVVVSRPDTRRGRRSAPTPSPVKAAAIEAGIRVSEDAAAVVDAGVELGVVVAFGQLVRPPVLARVPMVNLHFSLLPRWRGAAPVERAILAGDEVTGVCLMALEEGLDTGGVYRRTETAIGAEETAEVLRARLATLGTESLVEALATGLGVPEPQVGVPTYAAKLSPADRHLDWGSSAEALARVVRIGRAWTTWRGRRLLVLDAAPAGLSGESGSSGLPVGSVATDDDGSPVVATGRGGLVLRVVQPEGRGQLAAREWIRGARPSAEDRLGAG